jgi:hypothetical protein
VQQHNNPTNATATMAPPKKGWQTKEESNNENCEVQD